MVELVKPALSHDTCRVLGVWSKKFHRKLEQFGIWGGHWAREYDP